MKRAAALFSLCALVLLPGCLGETNRQVLKRYERQFAEKRQQLKKIADMLPARAPENGTTTITLTPTPIINIPEGKSNTDVITYQQLIDPDMENTELNFYFYSDLLRGIQWTGPKNPLTGMDEPASNVEKNLRDGDFLRDMKRTGPGHLLVALDERAGNMEKTLQNGLTVKYLIITRLVSLTEPTAINAESYSPGNAELEVFVVDMEDNKLLSAFHYTAATPESINREFPQNYTHTRRLEAIQDWAHSALFEDARWKFIALLEKTIGGEFVFH